jgi:superfamily I DNA/RNA helicase
VIRLFAPDELRTKGDGLFDIPVPVPVPAPAPAQRRETAPRRRTAPAREPAPPLATPPSPHEPLEPMLAGMAEVGAGLLDRLDAMQRVAASAPGGPLLIVAGPGTGKTRTLTHRIAYLCAESGVYPEECLAITFTRRAAEELRTRLDGLLGPVAADVTVGTFHSLGLTILRENAAAAGLSPGFRVAEETDRLAAVAEAVGLGSGEVADLRSGEAAGLGPREAAAGREARRLLAALVTDETLRLEYANRLHARDLVDLDELLTMPVALLSDDPSLVDRYRARWQWVFVDEYQDVDPVQYALLRLLCPPDGNLCAIGDPDQAIYSFRGADVSFFLRFAADFTEPRMVRLTRNYRSAAPILAAAVQAVAPTTLVPGRRLDPARLDPEAPLVGLYPAASAADEGDFVVRTIDELVGGVSHRSLDSCRVDSRAATGGALSFSDFAVLYRVDTQAATIVDALSRAGIPVQKRSHDRLLDRPGVAAIARELRFAGGLGGSLAARVRLTGQVLADRRAFKVRPPDEPAAPLTEADVFAAVDLVTPLAVRCGDDLARFLTELATGAEVDTWDPRADRVTLLTLHAAKGLEFPVVFVVGVEDGLLPLRLPGRPPTDDDVAEERRLFFVGLTRAEDRLFLSHTKRRFRHGAEREMAPSPFLSAIDPGLLERRGGDAPRRPRDRQLRLL